MTIVSIHQPQYIPWLPYFDKIDQSDYFVFLDSVQYQKNGLQNRNQVKTRHGPLWLTIPVHASLERTIQQTPIATSTWIHKHIRTLEMNYSRAEHSYLLKAFENLLEQQEWNYLADVTISVTRWMMTQLGITTPTIRSSELDVNGAGETLILNICQKLKADTYLSGVGAKNYQHETTFVENGIELRYQSYQNAPYRQCFMDELGFIKDLSALDLILNEGANARVILLAGRT